MTLRLSIALFLACLALPAQPADAVLAKALRAHSEGSFEAAAAGYREYLQSHPSAYEIRSNLGAALAGMGLYADAILEYKAALKLAPDNLGIGLNLALAYYKNGDVATAAGEFARLRPRAPDHRQVTLLLADCWLQMAENKKVIDLLEPLDARSPDDIQLAYILGTALIHDKRMEEGQKVLDRIFARGESAEGYLLMGTAKLSLAAVSDDYAGPVKDLAKAVALNPRLPNANAYYGQALLGAGDAAAAEKAFRAELAVNPSNFEAELNLAVLVKQNTNYAEARRLLEAALRIRPGNSAVLYQLATVDLAEGKVAEARAGLEGLVKQYPEFIEAHVSLAAVYYRLKMRAEGDYEKQIVQRLKEGEDARQHQEYPAGTRKNP